MNSVSEQSLVLIKPDGMARGLAGEIIARFEKVGLKIVAAQVKTADEDLASKHYPVTDEWYEKVGNNTLSDCQKYGVDAKEAMGTDVAIEIGKKIHQYNREFLMSGPVLALIFEGPHAVELIRKLVGHTVPVLSAPGTIRGDFSNESAVKASMENRSIYNLIHASGSVDEAQREIELWFGK